MNMYQNKPLNWDSMKKNEKAKYYREAKRASLGNEVYKTLVAKNRKQQPSRTAKPNVANPVVNQHLPIISRMADKAVVSDVLPKYPSIPLPDPPKPKLALDLQNQRVKECELTIIELKKEIQQLKQNKPQLPLSRPNVKPNVVKPDVVKPDVAHVPIENSIKLSPKSILGMDFVSLSNSLHDVGVQMNLKFSKNTAIRHLQRINVVYRKIFKKEFDFKNFDWLLDTVNVIKQIDIAYPLDSTRREKISAISSIIGKIQGFEEAYKHYYKKHMGLKDNLEEKVGENKLSESEKKNILPWDQILKLRSKINTTAELLLFDLYTKFPPRRNQAIQLLTIVNNITLSKVKQMKNTHNYILTKNGIGTQIILNVYKTADKYGQYIMDIPKELGHLVKKYIREYGLSGNDPLFPTEKGGYYVSWKRVTELFKKYAKRNIGTKLLRNSFISFQSMSKNLSINERKKLATQLGHSEALFLQYIRLDIGDA
jgi:hypothetical protein